MASEQESLDDQSERRRWPRVRFGSSFGEQGLSRRRPSSGAGRRAGGGTRRGRGWTERALSADLVQGGGWRLRTGTPASEFPSSWRQVGWLSAAPRAALEAGPDCARDHGRGGVTRVRAAPVQREPRFFSRSERTGVFLGFDRFGLAPRREPRSVDSAARRRALAREIVAFAPAEGPTDKAKHPRTPMRVEDVFTREKHSNFCRRARGASSARFPSWPKASLRPAMTGAFRTTLPFPGGRARTVPTSSAASGKIVTALRLKGLSLARNAAWLSRGYRGPACRTARNSFVVWSRRL